MSFGSVRVNRHDRRNPFHQHRAVLLRPFQPRQGVAAIRIHRRAKQQVRVPRRHFRHELIRHINFRPVRVEVPIGVHHAVEREQDGPADIFALGERFRNAVAHQTVALLQKFLLRNAEAAQINLEPPVVPQAGTKQNSRCRPRRFRRCDNACPRCRRGWVQPGEKAAPAGRPRRRRRRPARPRK